MYGVSNILKTFFPVTSVTSCMCLHNKMNLSSMLKATVVLSKLRKPLNAIVPVLATVQFTVQLKSCDVML